MFKKWTLSFAWIVFGFLFICLSSVSNQSLILQSSMAEATSTESRFNDFYKRQRELKKDEARIEEGRLKYKENKKKQDVEAERIEAQYAKSKKDIDQEKEDRVAEQWMAKQEREHEEALEKAKQKYISSQKESLKYKIPESEEFEVK